MTCAASPSFLCPHWSTLLPRVLRARRGVFWCGSRQQPSTSSLPSCAQRTSGRHFFGCAMNPRSFACSYHRKSHSKWTFSVALFATCGRSASLASAFVMSAGQSRGRYINRPLRLSVSLLVALGCPSPCSRQVMIVCS